MRIAVLGTTPITLECIKEFKKNKWQVVTVISLPKDKLPLNSVSLKDVSSNVGAIYYETNDINNSETENFLRSLNIDYIFSTWPYIIKDNILNIPQYYVIGSHPTQLPYNKGRHSLHWLICLGIDESYVSMFIMNSKIDGGNIITQEPYSCVYKTGIRDVYINMVEAYKKAIDKVCSLLINDPLYSGEKQNDALENYWRKRNIYDIMIDFRMTAKNIYRLVKSFNKPYECAVLVYKNFLFRIVDAETIHDKKTIEEIQRMEYGKIIWVKKNSICVKAADEMITLYVDENDNLLNANFEKYIYPPSKYIVESDDLYSKLLEYNK